MGTPPNTSSRCTAGWKDCESKSYRSQSHPLIEHPHIYISNMGYKRGDPSTVSVYKLPLISEKGMCMHYGVAHENFVWQIRRSVVSSVFSFSVGGV